MSQLKEKFKEINIVDARAGDIDLAVELNSSMEFEILSMRMIISIEHRGNEHKHPFEVTWVYLFEKRFKRKRKVITKFYSSNTVIISW